MEDTLSTKGSALETAVNCSFSLCIYTMDSPQELADCLRSIHEGSDIPDEIIVSDGSQDSLATQLVISQYPKVIYQRDPQPGSELDRNTCLHRAKEDYLILIDDEIRIPADFCKIARQLITSFDRIAIINCQSHFVLFASRGDI